MKCWLVVFSIGLSPVLCWTCAGEINPKAELGLSALDVVNKVIDKERDIKDVQARFSAVIVETGFPNYEYAWGYSGGKEFLKGRVNYTGDEEQDNTKIRNRTDVMRTFNGEKMFILRKDVEAFEAGVPPHGSVLPLDAKNFTTVLTPNVLLGYGIHEAGRLSLGEAIRQADSFTMWERTDSVGGRPCCVIEAHGVLHDPAAPEEVFSDVRIWIDYERDFRPLKIEEYFGSSNAAAKWKALIRRIDNVKLKRIDGVWFPVEGTRSYYQIDGIDPPSGMSREAFHALSPDQQRAQGVVRLKKEPLTRRMKVKTDTLRINKGIPDDNFIVNFPIGCKVWDDFAQLGYTVGGKNNAISPRIETTIGGTSVSDGVGDDAKVGPNQEDAEVTLSSASSQDGVIQVDQQPVTPQAGRNMAQKSMNPVKAWLSVLFVGIAVVSVIIVLKRKHAPKLSN